ncbi:MAG: hypothetical protein KJ058_19575 [Thermoanaerobaculia bacterium]|nr:hypothetical protein [Thermoanaerobaculia bacterium]
MLRRLPNPDLRERARQLIDERGADRAAKTLGIGRESAMRLAAGLRVRRGTIALAERALERLEVSPAEQLDPEELP